MFVVMVACTDMKLGLLNLLDMGVEKDGLITKTE